MLPPDQEQDAPPMNTPDQDTLPQNPLVTVPMDPDALKKWKGDLDRADRRRKVFEPQWEKNLQKYTPDPTNAAWGDEINVGVDFYTTEQKKDQLFFDTPTVILTPEPDNDDPNLAQQIEGQQAKLNRKIGRKGLDMKRLMDELAVDIICPAGIGVCKVGVTIVTKDAPAPLPGPDGQPIMAPVPVYQKIFAERSSPKTVLIPTNFHSTQFDKAPWLGLKFAMPTRAAIRQFQLPPDFLPTKTSNADDQIFQQGGVKPDTDDEQVTGKEVWYRAHLYDDNVWHPDHLRQLVFIDGFDDPVVHRDSPYQSFQNGVLQPAAPGTMDGNPICIVTLRDLPDSSYPPSDCTIMRPLVNELNRFRTQLVEHRDASTSIRLANEDVITPEILAKIVHGPYGSMLPIPGSAYDPSRPPVMEITHPVMSRESFQSQDTIERDISKITTLGANQSGSETNTTHSATEMTYVERNSDVRLQAERDRFIGGFLNIVSKIDALMAKFETQPGQQPVSGYSYDIKPDSGRHVDAASDRKFALDRYNMFAKAPNVNQQYLLTELAPQLDLDPSKLFVPPQPPKAEPPKTSVIVKGEDISPLAPQYQNMIQILTEIGMAVTAVPITPEMVTNAALQKPIKPAKSAPHGGSPEQADKVNQHVADLSGNVPNLGGQAGAH
jgi:hypothetical protein